MKKQILRLGVLTFTAVLSAALFAGAEQDFAAAFKAGKPLSAEAAYRKLTKDNAKVAPIVHYQAAQVAEWSGQWTPRRDRLNLFVRSEKNWTPEVEQALWALTASGDDIAQYQRLTENVKPSSALWANGTRMLKAYFDARRYRQGLQLAEVLLQHFTETDQVRHVFDSLLNYARWSNGTFPVRELRPLFAKYPRTDIGSWREFVWRDQGTFDAEWVLDVCVKNKLYPADILPRALGTIDGDGWSRTTNETEKARIETLSKKMKASEAFWLAAKDIRVPTQYYMTSLRFPNYFYSDLTTNNQTAASGKLLEQVLACEYDKKDEAWRKGRINDMLVRATGWRRWSGETLTAFVDRHPELVSTDWLCQFSSVGNVFQQSDKEKGAVAPFEKLCQKFPKQAEAIRRYSIGRYSRSGDRARAEAYVMSVIGDSVVSFNCWDVLSVLNDCKAMTFADKIAVLKKAFSESGWNDGWVEMEKAVANNRNWELPKSKEYADFIAGLSKTAAAQDKLRRAAYRMSKAKTEGALAILEEAVKAYPSRYPDPKCAKDNWPFGTTLWRSIELLRDAPAEDAQKFCALVLPKIGAGYDQWNWLDHMVRRANSVPTWRLYYDTRKEVLGENDALANMVVARDSEKPFEGIDMKVMSPWRNFEYVKANCNNLKWGPARWQLVFDWVAARPLTKNSPEAVNWMCEQLVGIAREEGMAAKIPLKAFDDVLANKDPKWNGTAVNVLRVAGAAGRLDEVLKGYVARMDAMGVEDRAVLVGDLLQTAWHTQKTGWVGLFEAYADAEKKKTDTWGPLVAEKLVPLLKSLTPTEAAKCSVNYGSILEIMGRYRDYYSNKDHKDEAKVAMANDFYAAFAQASLNGLRRSHDSWREGFTWGIAYLNALAASNAVAMAQTAQKAACRVGWGVHPNWMGELISRTQKTPFVEPLFLLVNSLPGDCDGNLQATANKVRASISSKIPGIYPVGENDPAYPLYVAADELAKKNPERAWQLLQDQKNQTVFEREALKLPPDFVIWGVEQLRMQRGEKDKSLLRARQIATMILAQESKVSPEMAAAMVLSRAEGYRDQQNFEAAKLEYQSIRNNPAYHSTKYGKKAMFRATDLQIESGNAQAVEATLEYWLSQNDREIQAEAHYFQAKIAFDRKDYDECIKQLRHVFAINYTHTEGRFLHGQWKLATNSEVDDTDVLVGDLTERNMIRPGNELTVTVQDANLSVAGGGASIPVIVRTSPGKDEERINLYPTSRDPSNFKGLVPVQLGKANPSNRVIEVAGNDIVSYVIDPDFLKERGLPLNEPKRLVVIDDGKLAIGAGAPRTEEKKTEKGVKDMLDEDNAGSSAVTMRLRPGNPLYVVVQDRDCSLGGSNDTVKVSVETSSGDRLRGFELIEEKPFTGVFRGKVETSLPPPRAFAHDTAAGLNPGDVINRNKSGGWKSLSDSQPGKWFEVDTMASHLFKEIELEMPGVEDIKTIKLVGQMGSKVMQLGQLPAAPELSKLYLRHQQQYDRTPKRSLGDLRAFCQTDRAAKSKIVEKIEYRALGNGRDWQTALFSGPFMVPEGLGSLRLRLQPISTKKDALRNLWVAIALDGEEIYSGQGDKLQNALVSCDIAPGCHKFEMAVVSQTHEDDFDLALEPFGEEPRPLPADWFNEEKHPELKDFVKDQAKIVKSEKGFKAVFKEPVMLRSFRWEFSDVRSPAVAITRITAKNEKDEVVLPVESDFSDSQDNSTLEVAPGDWITVKYEDERTTTGEKKVLQRQMSSSFTDASVRFIYEDADEHGHVTAYDAYRFQPGDSLVVCVADADCDTTDKADEITVEIKNSAGKTSVRKLREYQPKWGGDAQSHGMHSGIFYGVLKTCLASNTNAPANVMRVTSDDLLTVSYEDRENTDPGVPFARTTRIFAARPAIPELTLFDVRKSKEVDKSADAAVMLERIRRRPGNENVQVVYRDVLTAEPMDKEASASTNPIPVNVSAGLIPIRVNDRSRARYSCSKIMIEAVAHSELEKAAAEGRDPDKVTVALDLGGSLWPFKVLKGDQSGKEALKAGTFNGLIRLSLGPIDPNIEVSANAPQLLCVTGSDLIDVTILGEDGKPVIKRTLKLVSNGTIGLTDSSFAAERNEAHVGESFFVKVDDADCDATDEPDRINVEVISSLTGRKRPMTLTETMPHSGIFTGRLRPVMFAPNETIPSVSTGGVASANEILTEERFAVNYGDQVIFKYVDKQTLPGTEVNVQTTTGMVFRGANGDIRMFSKRFADRDTAVLVQFRLAECLFEQAKEHRKLKQPEKSAAAIDEGKFILEEALKNYPDSAHVVQGEYLLANLYQELATEQRDAGEMDKARPLYQEALSRFSQILGTWPEGEFAARSQFHKALCLEMLQDYSRASEEYVKMTYLYPESELVGEATIRLATYYYTKEKRFDISGHIYKNFQQRFPQHNKAARALFMAGSCYIKQAETIAADIAKKKAKKEPLPQGGGARIKAFYGEAVKTFATLIETYRDGDPKLRAQTLYWAGDVSVRNADYSKAYQYLKRTVFEYPETEWARRARGLLLQEGRVFKDLD